MSVKGERSKDKGQSSKVRGQRLKVKGQRFIKLKSLKAWRPGSWGFEKVRFIKKEVEKLRSSEGEPIIEKTFEYKGIDS